MPHWPRPVLLDEIRSLLNMRSTKLLRDQHFKIFSQQFLRPIAKYPLDLCIGQNDLSLRIDHDNSVRGGFQEVPEHGFSALALREVAVDLKPPQGKPVYVLLQRPVAGDGHLSAVFARVHQLALPTPIAEQFILDVLERLRENGFQDIMHRPPQYFLLPPAVKPFGASVPVVDAFVEAANENGIVRLLEELCLPADRRLRFPARGDILQRNQDQLFPAAPMLHGASVHEQNLPANLGILAINFQIDDRGPVGEDLLQRLTELREIPLPLPEIVDGLVLRLLAGELEKLIKSLVRGPHFQVRAKQYQRRRHSLDDGFGIKARFGDLRFQRVNIVQSQHRALDLVLCRAKRARPQ